MAGFSLVCDTAVASRGHENGFGFKRVRHLYSTGGWRSRSGGHEGMTRKGSCVSDVRRVPGTELVKRDRCFKRFPSVGANYAVTRTGCTHEANLVYRTARFARCSIPEGPGAHK